MIIQYVVKPEAVTEAIGLIEVFVSAVAEHEPDVLRYETFQHADKISFTHLVHFYDETARQKHQTTEHTVTFNEALSGLCDQAPIFSEVTPISSNE